MLNSQELLDLSQIDIESVDMSTLVDISTVVIDKELPHKDKVLSYIEQIGNPYCFLSDGIPVRMRFVGRDKSLSQSLVNYFSQLKNR